MENLGSQAPAQQETNCFIIDWLTFVAHGETVDNLLHVMGLDNDSVLWDESQKFRNGYPRSLMWSGITISYGADDERFYDDPSKVRNDMGICVNFSGTGCRAFESHGSGDWFKLLGYLYRSTPDLVKTDYHAAYCSYNVTRIDLAFDDHTGLLDMRTMEQAIRNREFVSKTKKTYVHWSDDQFEDIQGMTLEIGSPKSDVLIRIYDKAAERGFKDRHWVRVELQLRKDRALVASRLLLEEKHIGKLSCGILQNYFTFREPTADSNRYRWPLTDYWRYLLQSMEAISLWLSPGEPYNFSKTEHALVKQYGAAIVALTEVNDRDYLIDQCKELFSVEDLPAKYKSYIAQSGHKTFGDIPQKRKYAVPDSISVTWGL